MANRLHFGMLKDAYVRILDQTGHELVSFLMTDYYNNVISMMIGELYQHNGAWKFNAVGDIPAKAGVHRGQRGGGKQYFLSLLNVLRIFLNS